MGVRQGLVEQGIYRQQENSHLEWPQKKSRVSGREHPNIFCYKHISKVIASNLKH